MQAYSFDFSCPITGFRFSLSIFWVHLSFLTDPLCRCVSSSSNYVSHLLGSSVFYYFSICILHCLTIMSNPDTIVVRGYDFHIINNSACQTYRVPLIRGQHSFDPSLFGRSFQCFWHNIEKYAEIYIWMEYYLKHKNNWFAEQRESHVKSFTEKDLHCVPFYQHL